MEGILAMIIGWTVIAAIIGLFKNNGKNDKSHSKSGNIFTGNYVDKIVQDTAKNNSKVKQKEQPKKDDGNWIYIVIAVTAVALAIGFISLYITQKQQGDSAKKEASDANYCRSIAAQYGQQGTDAFSSAYNACMKGKGW